MLNWNEYSQLRRAVHVTRKSRETRLVRARDDRGPPDVTKLTRPSVLLFAFFLRPSASQRGRTEWSGHETRATDNSLLSCSPACRQALFLSGVAPQRCSPSNSGYLQSFRASSPNSTWQAVVDVVVSSGRQSQFASLPPRNDRRSWATCLHLFLSRLPLTVDQAHGHTWCSESLLFLHITRVRHSFLDLLRKPYLPGVTNTTISVA